MDASKISEIITEKTKRYNAILIDGAWGIGKTYEVEKCVKENNTRVFYLSLFGIESPSSIYKALLLELCPVGEKKKRILGRIRNVVDKVDGSLSNTLESYGAVSGAIKSVVGGVFAEKTIVANQLDKLKDAIIILDDLERINNSVSMVSLLGVLEEIKKHAKIIVIANLDKMYSEQKENLEVYSEKIFSKVYKITQCSTSINWNELGVDELAKSLFEENKQLLNLRVIQRGQYLYDDLVASFKKEYSEPYLELIHQICYEVVFEDYLSLNVDKYFEDEEIDEASKAECIVSKVASKHTGRDHIVMWRLIHNIYMFFLFGESVNEDEIYAESHIFDLGLIAWSISIDEVDATKKKIIQYMKDAKEVYELDYLVVKYIDLSNFTSQSFSDVLVYYKESMKKILLKISEVDFRYWDKKVKRQSTSIPEIEKVYEEVVTDVNKSNVDRMIEYLSRNVYDATAVQYAHWLMPVCQNMNLIEYLIEKGEILISNSLIPAKINSYIEGEIRYSLIRTLYDLMPQKMDKFMNERDIDKLAKFRIDAITARKNIDVHGFYVSSPK